jgi:hypothetical protein
MNIISINELESELLEFDTLLKTEISREEILGLLKSKDSPILSSTDDRSTSLDIPGRPLSTYEKEMSSLSTRSHLLFPIILLRDVLCF